MALIEITRVDDAFAMEAVDANGHSLRIDAAETIGGKGSGIRPMQLLLAGLGGCGGIDILSILRKQRQEITSFRMLIDGERETGKEPALWKKVQIRFIFAGNVDADKAARACALSLEKYCSVAATLRAAGCEITWAIAIE